MDWLFGGKSNAAGTPHRSADEYLSQNRRISDLEDKINYAQIRIDELQNELDERYEDCQDEDSDEYFYKQGRIDDVQFEIDVLESEVEDLREKFEDDWED